MDIINAGAYRHSVAGIEKVFRTDITAPSIIFACKFKIIRVIVIATASIAILISRCPYIADRIIYVNLVCIGIIIPITIARLGEYN